MSASAEGKAILKEIKALGDKYAHELDELRDDIQVQLSEIRCGTTEIRERLDELETLTSVLADPRFRQGRQRVTIQIGDE